MARILVVEDERSIQQLVCEVLVEAGHDVTPANHGADALRQIEETGMPDLVVLDMWMPVMNGWQFAEALQQRGIRVPLVVMTAAREARQRATEVGAAAYIGKPFDVDQFADTVTRVIQGNDKGDAAASAGDLGRQAVSATEARSRVWRVLLAVLRGLPRSRPVSLRPTAS